MAHRPALTLRGLSVACVLLAARAALACPNCMAGRKDLTPVLRTVAGFMIVPFLACALIVFAIVRAMRAARAAEPAPDEPRESATGAAVGGDGASAAK